MCEERSLGVKRGSGKAGRLRVMRLRRNAELLRRRLLSSDSEVSQPASPALAEQGPAPEPRDRPTPETAAPDAARRAMAALDAARIVMMGPVAGRIPMGAPDAAIMAPADAARIAAVAQENSRSAVLAARAALAQAPHRPPCQGPCCETARQRRRESLLDIALRTAVLMRSNRELQIKLRALQDETRDYIKAVMRNRENNLPPLASTLHDKEN